jgi:catechol 2,3-dioxygenase-like lactoylglutathione lyase family enzyme
VFRQVVAYRWAEDASAASRDRCREALAGLTIIPELTCLTLGDDAGHFEGNHDFVAVMDFPDFAAARRYVSHERHQAFVRDHASKIVAERVIVQHDWALEEVAGLYHVKLPVADVTRSRDWYQLAFGLVVEREFQEGARLAGVSLIHPTSPLRIALREDPVRAAALAGFDAVALTVATPADLQALLHKLDGLGIVHGEPVTGPAGVVVDVPDPDGIHVRLFTLQHDNSDAT